MAGTPARVPAKVLVLDQFGLCSITLGLEFPVFHQDLRDTPFATPL